MKKAETAKEMDARIIILRDVFFRFYYGKKHAQLYFGDIINLDTAEMDHITETIREEIKKKEKELEKLAKETKYKPLNKEMLFCERCGKITKHSPHSYEDRPLGFGGWTSNYDGFMCKCGNLIYQSTAVELGLL